MRVASRAHARVKSNEKDYDDDVDDAPGTNDDFESVDTPAWAKDLTIDPETGDLIVESTGKPLNEFGATRFDLYVRALRGEYDAADSETQTEENSVGEIFETIQQFPCKYTYQVVCLKADVEDEGFVRSVVRRVVGGDATVKAEVVIKDRGHTGKYAAIWASTWVYSAKEVNECILELKENPKVIMCY
ncbi:hypothetical protein BE221DRAFT_142937 [Ostreococcus tauri]|uniref:Uncharacterized protein n=1 Tax=Ostreococcus tauri TaxID=70448 RepID=A0A1Y5HY86_OSTTA|nr:hypothetical protein BE221DRAFT_142937 [Ostreococcus tauri]